MYDKVITSKGKQKQYLCDYCKKTFDKEDVVEVKWRLLSITWPYYWKRYFMCWDCKSKRVYKDDNGDYLD